MRSAAKADATTPTAAAAAAAAAGDEREISASLAKNHANRGYVYARLGEYALAVEDYTRVVELEARHTTMTTTMTTMTRVTSSRALTRQRDDARAPTLDPNHTITQSARRSTVRAGAPRGGVRARLVVEWLVWVGGGARVAL